MFIKKSLETKHILVHLHLYYYDQLDFFIDKLRNISHCNWDLYVTVCEKDEKNLLRLKEFKPDVNIIEVKNIGYDIWPFIQVIKIVDLDKYDYVLKMHTKNFRYKQNHIQGFKYNGKHFTGFFWRDQLVNAVLLNSNRFLKILKIFNSNKKIGFISDKAFLVKLQKHRLEDIVLLDDMKKRLNINSNYEYFLAGTMFIMRACILKRLANSDLCENDFATISATNSISTYAHALERIFTILTDDSGYKIYGIPDKSLNKYLQSNNLSILEKIFSIRNSKDKRHKIITILGLKFKIKR